MDNDKFLDTFNVLGILRKDMEKELRESKLDLSDSYKVLSKFIKNNHIRYDRGEKGLILDCLEIWNGINKNHICHMDLSEILRLHKLSSRESILQKGDSLINMLDTLESDEDYEMNYDSLKIHPCYYGYIYYNGKEIKIRSIEKRGNLSKIVLPSGEEIYALVIKGDKEYKLGTKEIKSTDDLVRIILSRDYDLIYLPNLTDYISVSILEKYDNYTWMSNKEYLDLLMILNVVELFNVKLNENYDKVCDSRWDIKYVIKKLFLGEKVRDNTGSSVCIRFLGQLVEVLEQEKDEKTVKEKLKLLGDMIHQFNNLFQYSVMANMTSRLLYDGGYKSLDDMINRFKRLYSTEIKSVLVSPDESYNLNDSGYIEYCNGKTGKRLLYNNENYIVVYRDLKINLKKIGNMIKEMENEKIMFVIGGKEFG